MALTKAKVVVFGRHADAKSLFLQHLFKLKRPLFLLKKTSLVDLGNFSEEEVFFDVWYSHSTWLDYNVRSLLSSKADVAVFLINPKRVGQRRHLNVLLDEMEKFKRNNPYSTVVAVTIAIKKYRGQPKLNLAILGYMEEVFRFSSNKFITLI